MVALFTKYYFGNKMKVDEVVGESRMYVGLYEMFTEFFLINPNLQNLGVNGRIILRERRGGCGLYSLTPVVSCCKYLLMLGECLSS
jgi:hypothetical protein